MSKVQKGIPTISPAIILAAVTVSVAVFYLGYLAGSLRDGGSVVSSKELFYSNAPVSLSKEVDFNQFWDVWSLVQNRYIGTGVTEKQLFYGALEGMLSALDDPYSVFFTPTANEQFNNDLNGNFFGIGAEIGKENDVLVVIAPLTDAPADKAGLRAGDRILAIDGVETFGMTVPEAVSKIRGEDGTVVVLTVGRDASQTPVEISITRGEIHIDSVQWDIRDDGIAVIELSLFNDETLSLFQLAVQDILAADVKGIVLDLRNNPGGVFQESIDISGYWVDKDVIVMQRVGDKTQSFESSGRPRLAGIPTVVLVNEGTASSSEIVAGALQDYGLATVIGMQTFGKGSVQEYYEYRDGSALKVTVAEWLTPKGREINAAGIVPDIIVEFTEEDFHAGKTPQLDAAIDYLTQSP